MLLMGYFQSAIGVPPEINTHFITTFPESKGEVPINVSPYINGSARLVIMNDDIVAQLRPTYRKRFQPYSYF